MAVARVQAKANSTATSTVTVGSGQAWAAPTAGHLLVAFVAAARTGDTISITSQPWTTSRADSVSSGNQQGLFSAYRVADGTETTVTAICGGVSTNIALAVIEYSGAAAFGPGVGPFDYKPLYRDLGASLVQSIDTGTLFGTRAANEVWLAALSNGGNPITGAAATNGYTVLLNAGRLLVAEKIVSAKGDAQTTLSWTSTANRSMAHAMTIADTQLPPWFSGWGSPL